MRSKRMAAAGLMSLALCAVVAATALQGQPRLGAPSYWAWVLTGIQVLALWAAGGRRSWGWLLGASVQPVWITYAIFTGQLGFIPGCAISAVVQMYRFVRTGPADGDRVVDLDVSWLRPADLTAVDALARLQLAATQRAYWLRLHGADQELADLPEFV